MESRTREDALEKPLPGDRWKKGENTLGIERWDGTSGVFAQVGMMSQMFICNWSDNMLASFRRWCAGAEYLGSGE